MAGPSTYALRGMPVRPRLDGAVGTGLLVVTSVQSDLEKRGRFVIVEMSSRKGIATCFF